MRTKRKSTSSSFLISRLKSFTYASKGILHAVKSEPSLRIHLIAACVVIAFGLIVKITIVEWLFIIFAIGFVLSAELFNSSVESFVDLVQPEQHKFAGQAKDMAAGAVLISVICAILIGCIIFLPKLL